MENGTMEQSGNAARKGGTTLTVTTTIDGSDPKRPKMAAYAFTSAGTPIAHARLDEQGNATIPLPDHVIGGEALRVLVGPDLNEHGRVVAYDELQRYDAVEQRVHVSAEDAGTAHLRVSEEAVLCWFPHYCRVRGRVVKRVLVHGHPVDQPLCHATVRIYEVDAFNRIILNIPYDILDRLRHELLIPTIRVPRIPNPPDPPPFEVDPGFIDPAPIQRIFERALSPDASQIPTPRGFSPNASLGLTGARQGMQHGMQAMNAGHGSAGATTMATGASAMASQRSAAIDARSIGAAEALPGPLVDGALAAQLRGADEAKLRSLIAANASLFKPYLCYWPWWTYYTTHLLATVPVDDDGRFDVSLFLGCVLRADEPDLYFTVEQDIGGTGVLVYHPPIPCNTYWDYVCGSAVQLVVTDPRAITCRNNPMLPDGGVTIVSVGHRSLVDIYGSGASPVTAANKGLLGIDISTGYNNAPFGGQIAIIADFGPDLSFRAAPGLATPPNFYYRWSYRQLDPSTLAPTTGWEHLITPVAWHYRFPVGGDVMYPTKQFGPVVVNGQINLFEVPRLGSPDGDSLNHYWYDLNEIVDRPCAYFDTRVAPPGAAVPLPIAGKVELRLELFDAVGTKLNPAAAGVQYRMPRVGDPASSTLIGTVHTDPVTPQNINVDGDFYFTVHFDNNPSNAVSDPPSLSSGAVTDACGFLRYTGGETVTLNYHPTHPNGHAVYSFSLVRGAPPPSHVEGGEVGLGGTFTLTWGPTGWDTSPPIATPHLPTVAELLQTCEEGAFNANLYVTGKATNGWGRIGYDDFFPRAFALARAHP
jgi:hypothetical protein